MGSISISCNVSLSKKLRKILDNGKGRISLTVSDIKNGKGVGYLSLSNEEIDISSDAILGLGETSIMVTPISMSQELPGNMECSAATLFSTFPLEGKDESIVKKIAATSAPEQAQISTAVGEVKTPQDFEMVQDEACREYIQDLEGLINAVNEARKTKKSDIDLGQALNDRERAILFEQKEKDEAIDVSAYIVNEKAAKIIVNDIGIDLSLNMPYDLSNISARRIASSKDLKELIRSGFVRFISPTEVEAYVNKAVHGMESMSAGLEVYNSPAEAEAAIATTRGPLDTGDVLDIVDGDVGRLTEEENMMMNLTSGLPTAKKESSPEGTRVTSHGSSPSQRPQASSSGKNEHTTIRRTG